MSRLRKVLFTESSPNIGGQELQLLAQAEALSTRGVEVLLVCRPGSRIGESAACKGIAVAHLPFRNSLHLPSLIGLYRLLRRYRPDAIIAHSGHDANTVALAARLLWQRPLLVRSRTYQPGVPNAWTYNILFDLTLVPSQFLRDMLLRNPRIKGERIRVLYPGIDFDQPSSSGPVPPWLEGLLQSGRRIVLHAAMLRPEKGHQVILAALPELIQRYPSINYVIAGEGGFADVLQHDVATRGLQSHVTFAGMICDLPSIMRHAELLVMPSNYEPLGMSQIEALGMQIPVIASRTGGIPETIDDKRTGLLAEPNDVDDWRAKLRWALDHPEQMQAMARAGCKVVRQQFSRTGNIEQLERHLIDGISQLQE
jgi:glycosyltransferase involved in cell wall biosynthesis